MAKGENLSDCPCADCAYRACSPFQVPCLHCWEKDWELFRKADDAMQSRILSFPKNEPPKCLQCGGGLVEEGSLLKNESGVWYWDGHKVWGCPSCNRWGMKIGDANAR